MAMNLDPREVLEHLRELGYTNISPAQLKDFIQDLKKLMKYDMKVIEKQMEEELKLSTLQVPSPHSHRSVVSPTTASLADENKRSRRTDKGCRCLESRPPSQNTARTDQVDSKENPSQRKSESQDDKPQSIYSAISKENLAPPHRTGFIRPWKLQPGSQKPGAASNRCDPVTLYHKYQAYWRQNKVPGESPHSNLRWNVRERMLGQDPHPQPRPISRASSFDSTNKRRVQMR